MADSLSGVIPQQRHGLDAATLPIPLQSNPTEKHGAQVFFGIFSAGHFFFGLTLSSSLFGICVCHKVKDPEQSRVQDVVPTFFTGAPLPLHWKQ